MMGPPKISLLLDAKSTPALIIKPILILAHKDDLGWYQQGRYGPTMGRYVHYVPTKGRPTSRDVMYQPKPQH